MEHICWSLQKFTDIYKYFKWRVDCCSSGRYTSGCWACFTESSQKIWLNISECKYYVKYVAFLRLQKKSLPITPPSLLLTTTGMSICAIIISSRQDNEGHYWKHTKMEPTAFGMAVKTQKKACSGRRRLQVTHPICLSKSCALKAAAHCQTRSISPPKHKKVCKTAKIVHHWGARKLKEGVEEKL